MASVVEICNRALQKLGASRITDINDDSVNARACLSCYSVLRDAELQKHRWGFAIERVSLAADATEPEFGKAYSYTLPGGYLKAIPPYPEMNSISRDWVIEGRKILTNESAPLAVRFIKQVVDPTEMSPLFREALACKMAFEMCEQLTQSNSKKADARTDYKDAISEAKKSSAIESVPAEAPEDSWITGRS